MNDSMLFSFLWIIVHIYVLTMLTMLAMMTIFFEDFNVSFHVVQLPVDHCPHLRAHSDQGWWRSANAKVCYDFATQDLIQLLMFFLYIWTFWHSCSRYLDILMGLSMLVSLVSLEYGSMSGEKAPLALFLILRFINFWLLQTLNRIVVCGWTLCESHLFIRLYFDIFQPSEKSAFDHNLPLHTLDVFYNIFYIIYDSNQHTAWRPLLAIGFGSSTSSTSRWRMKPQKRFNKHKDWAQIHFLFNLNLIRASSLNNHQFLSLQQGGVGVWVTGVYIVVVLPVLLFYRYLFFFFCTSFFVFALSFFYFVFLNIFHLMKIT